MAKKSKERSETEYLRAENRKLKSELRETKRALSRYEKRSHVDDDSTEEDEHEEIYERISNKCGQCGKGVLSSVSIGVRTLITCSVCNYRETKR